MKEVVSFKVLKNISLSDEFYMLVLQHPSELQPSDPGQFVQVLIEGNADVFLRRPISIYDVDLTNHTLSLLIQKVGEGTKTLSHIHAGESLDIIYPLGTGYPLEGKRPLLVGGGVGIAPLWYLAKRFLDIGVTPTVLTGFRSAKQILLKKDFESIVPLKITTEDGSCGEKGFVTQHSLWKTGNFDSVFTCGPNLMMKAVAAQSRALRIPCYVSLENMMACGIGACLCCVAETHEGHNVCTCTEGPVFLASTLKEFK